MVAALIIGWAASFGFRRRRSVYLALLLATILFVASLFLTIYAYEQQVSHLKQEYPNAETYYLSDDGITLLLHRGASHYCMDQIPQNVCARMTAQTVMDIRCGE
jgi:uncharacterized membrane protein